MTVGDKLLFDSAVAIVPYDNEIEWLKGTTDSYVDIHVNCSSKIEFEIVMEMNFIAGTETGFGVIGYDTYAEDTSRKSTFAYGNGTRVSTARSMIFGGETFWQPGLAWPSGKSTYQFKDNKLIENGVVLKTFASKSFATSKSMHLFANNHGPSSAFAPKEGNPGMTLYSCKIWEDKTLVRDFILVRIGLTGYMYDKVSGELFGNSGTGNFILGPDIK